MGYRERDLREDDFYAMQHAARMNPAEADKIIDILLNEVKRARSAIEVGPEIKDELSNIRFEVTDLKNEIQHLTDELADAENNAQYWQEQYEDLLSERETLKLGEHPRNEESR